MNWKDSYHGWLIELIPLPEGYTFKCWMPDQQIGISNNYVYPRLCQAIRAAQKRAKLESASLAIIGFLDEAYQNFHLNFEEYASLRNSIFDFTNLASQPRIRDY